MKRLVLTAVGLALVVGIWTMALTGCASDKVVEKIVVVTPTVAPTSTPEPKPALAVQDAAYYLDVTDTLPGFARLDPREEGMTKEAWAPYWGKYVEEMFSDFQLYLSEKPFDYVFMTMGVFPSKIDLAAWKAQMRDQETFSQQALAGFAKGFAARSGVPEAEAPQPSMTWRDVAVGDSAKLGEFSLLYESGQVQMDMVIMFDENAVVFIYDMWYPAEPPAVDILTIARAVSGRMANR